MNNIQLDIEILEREISQLKSNINEEASKAVISITELKGKLKEKKTLLTEKKELLKKSDLKIDSLLSKYSLNTIKNGIYKAKYYELNDLLNHVEQSCNKTNCATCVAYYFVNNEYGEWESVEMNLWLNQFIHPENDKKDNVYDDLANISNRISDFSAV